MSSLHAGAGVGDITPTAAVRLAGFMARQPAVPPLDVHDPLEARALALRSGDDTVLLIVCDLIGLAATVSAPLRLAVADATGVPVSRVLTACTHTHSGPDTLLGMDVHPGYHELLTAGVVAAARAAVDALRPADVGVATVDLPSGLAVNRRGLPFDPRLTVLDIWSAGQRTATLTNVGIHPVTHGPDVHVVTADWVGHFRRDAEAALGGTSILLSGPLGDVNPPGGSGTDRSGGGPGLARSIGRGVFGVAVAAAARAEPVGAGFSADYRTIELPVVEGVVPRLVSGGADRVVAELYEWQVGGVRVVSLPGEPLSAFGDAVVAARPGSTVVQAGLAPSWHGYLPHPDYFDPAGYEEGLGLGHQAMAELLAAVAA